MNKKEKLIIGIDIGGTKISGALVKDTGDILVRKKIPTPRKASAKQLISTIAMVIDDILKEAGITADYISGIGMGVPGVVDTDKGVVVVAPNINLRNINITSELKRKYKVKVLAGNDVNVGLLGEQWLGAGRGVKNVIGLFPGTGVGGAVITDGKMLSGVHGAAAELGHMIVEKKGPECTCGNFGCLEAVAGRWAIERDIRTAVKKGEKSKIKQIVGGKLTVIKSKILRKALKAKDPVVTHVMKRASVALGTACKTLRHIFDPEMIVFGGGVIEACSDFILPVIKKIVDSDPFFSKFPGCQIVESTLGDDAVLLGAVALVIGPQEDSSIRSNYSGEICVKGKSFLKDIFVRADGKVKKRSKKFIKKGPDVSLMIGTEELKKLCKKNPEMLLIGTRHQDKIEISPKGKEYLKDQGTGFRILSVSDAIRQYNKDKKKTAILINVT